MEVIQRPTVPPHFLQFSRRTKLKPHNHRPVCCFGLENHNSIELHQYKNDEPEKTHNLFTEAQRRATFIQPVYYSSFFNKEKIYGYPNDFERFSYFSCASLDYILKSGKQPNVIDIHNWETSIVGPLFWDQFVNKGLEATRIMLTCQSFKSQCLDQPDKLVLCGLNLAKLHCHDRLQDNNKPHLVNILKAGVVYSNKVIVMSSIHTKDQIVGTLSHGLEFALDTHKEKLLIAPFGYDDSSWDPSQDKFLPRGYTADDMRGKTVSKVALQQQLGLNGNIPSILVGYMFTEDSDVELENLKSLIWGSSKRGVQQNI